MGRETPDKLRAKFIQRETDLLERLASMSPDDPEREQVSKDLTTVQNTLAQLAEK